MQELAYAVHQLKQIKLKPSVEAFYIIWPGNQSDVFYSCRSPHETNNHATIQC